MTFNLDIRVFSFPAFSDNIATGEVKSQSVLYFYKNKNSQTEARLV